MSLRRTQFRLVLCFWPALAFAADDPIQIAGVAAAANPLQNQTIDRLSDTIARPLFMPGRRLPALELPPPVVVVERPPPPPLPPPSVVLLGITRNADDVRVALRIGSSNTVLSAQMGDDIGGWKIVGIEGRRVTLSLDDRTVAFTLFDNQAVKPASTNGNAAKPPPLAQTARRQD